MNNLAQRYHDAKTRLVSKFRGLDEVVDAAATIPGWVIPPATREVALRSFHLPDNPTIVEVGSFMGRSTSLLAGARRLRGSGKVHAIDPFDCSGDEYSIPHYEQMLESSGAKTLEEAFRNHIHRLELTPWVETYKGTSLDVVAKWDRPIDLLLLDGDQTPNIQRASYESWIPFLKEGGQFILNNAGEREYDPGHDGSYILGKQEVLPPKFHAKRVIQHTLFAIKA